MRSEIAALKAERDAWVAEAKLDLEVILEQREEIASLTAERDALRKDAERYRWLRNPNNWSEDGICPIVASGEDTIYGEHLDQSIDAAMTKETK